MSNTRALTSVGAFLYREIDGVLSMFQIQQSPDFHRGFVI